MFGLTQRNKRIHSPPLPSCCRLTACLPTTAHLHAWAPTWHSNSQQHAAHAHVRARNLKISKLIVFQSSHIFLQHSDIPSAEPVCFAYVTNNKQYLILSCSWEGGAPRALVWWEGPGGQSKSGEENSNILILRYGTARSGKPYTCHAKHPLLVETKTCRLTLGQCAMSHPPYNK